MGNAVTLLIELVVDIDNGTARVSEDRLDILLYKRLDNDFRSAEFHPDSPYLKIKSLRFAQMNFARRRDEMTFIFRGTTLLGSQ